MSKNKVKTPRDPNDEVVEQLADLLLEEMDKNPDRLEYNTRVLGGMFRNEAVALLDRAYMLLLERGFAERAGAVVSFFGVPKSLVRITEAGKTRARAVREEAASQRRAHG